MDNIKQINSSYRKSCAVGLLLSCYALFVEVNKEINADYVALCDINEHMSCTKAFSSEYGKGFGIIGSLFGKDSQLNQPNSLAGIIFYVLLLIISLSDRKNALKFQLCLCVMSNFMSVYLAYVLYFILKDFCIVCVGTYIVNAINLILTILKWNLIRSESKTLVNSKQKLKSK